MTTDLDINHDNSCVCFDEDIDASNTCCRGHTHHTGALYHTPSLVLYASLSSELCFDFYVSHVVPAKRWNLSVAECRSLETAPFDAERGREELVMQPTKLVAHSLYLESVPHLLMNSIMVEVASLFCCCCSRYFPFAFCCLFELVQMVSRVLKTLFSGFELWYRTKIQIQHC
jgi:hypothetical protein